LIKENLAATIINRKSNGVRKAKRKKNKAQKILENKFGSKFSPSSLGNKNKQKN